MQWTHELSQNDHPWKIIYLEHWRADSSRDSYTTNLNHLIFIPVLNEKSWNLEGNKKIQEKDFLSFWSDDKML